MDDRLYQVRVTALATDHPVPARIPAAFAELFCLTLPEAEARLAVLPVRVRGGLPVDLARKYERVLRRLGLCCEVLPDGEEGAPSPGPGGAPGPAGQGSPEGAIRPPGREPEALSAPPTPGSGVGEAVAVPASGPG
jgi:hypothetical protein